MNQLVPTVIGAVISFVIWAAFISFMWETHFLAGLLWTATPVFIAVMMAMKYLRL